MPPIKNSPHKTGKSMLFFTFEIPLFIVMSINSQIYMTKPKQARKTLPENTGKAFSVIMPPFSSKGGAQLRKWLYKKLFGILSPVFFQMLRMMNKARKSGSHLRSFSPWPPPFSLIYGATTKGFEHQPGHDDDLEHEGPEVLSEDDDHHDHHDQHHIWPHGGDDNFIKMKHCHLCWLDVSAGGGRGGGIFPNLRYAK